MMTANSSSNLSLLAILPLLTPSVRTLPACYYMLENSSMVPSKLRILHTKHDERKDKLTAFTYIIMMNTRIFELKCT
jgi:hypothetical protein